MLNLLLLFLCSHGANCLRVDLLESVLGRLDLIFEVASFLLDTFLFFLDQVLGHFGVAVFIPSLERLNGLKVGEGLLADPDKLLLELLDLSFEKDSFLWLWLQLNSRERGR